MQHLKSSPAIVKITRKNSKTSQPINQYTNNSEIVTGMHLMQNYQPISLQQSPSRLDQNSTQHNNLNTPSIQPNLFFNKNTISSQSIIQYTNLLEIVPASHQKQIHLTNLLHHLPSHLEQNSTHGSNLNPTDIYNKHMISCGLFLKIIFNTAIFQKKIETLHHHGAYLTQQNQGIQAQDTLAGYDMQNKLEEKESGRERVVLE